MSRFTTEVRYICEVSAGLDKSVGFNNVDDILNIAAPKIFDFDFPIYDEDYRLPLEKNILRHYYTREIGEETVGLWKLRLNAKLNEIMPYYNELYKSTLLNFNPLYDVNYETIGDENKSSNVTENFQTEGKTNLNHDTIKNEETASGSDVTTDNPLKYNLKTKNSGMDNKNIHGENTNKVETNSSTNETGRNKFRNSDTPQGGLNMTDVDENVYLTTAEIDDNTRNSNNKNNTLENRLNNNSEQNSFLNDTEESLDYDKAATTKIEYGKTIERDLKYSDAKTDERNSNNVKDVKDTNSYITKVIGKRNGDSYSKMLLEFRETFLNIDLMIIEELNDLFFGLWE